MKTYKIVKKPCYQISAVIILNILRLFLETSPINKEKIKEQFNDEQFEEIYFNNKFKSLLPKSLDFEYLPYKRNDSSYNSILKN